MDILKTLTDLQRIVILLANSNNREPIKGRLWLQKEVYLISNNIDQIKEHADYEGDYMGAYSETLEEELIQLEIDGILETKNYRILLTNVGEELANVLEEKIENKEILNIISDFKDLLNDMSQQELLAFIYTSFPDMTKESTVYEKLKPKLVNIAIQLYKKGKISIGKASEIAGISIAELNEKIKSTG